jgi:CHAD domain-containing protein
VVTRRRTLDLRDSRGVRCVEIDDDDVTVTADGHDVEQFRELEVELADGVPTDLLTTVVDALRAAGARAAEPVPKVLHALGPAGREPPDLAVPKLDKRSALVTVVVAAVAAGHARLVEHDPDVRLGGDPEAVHQSRVATRRLRSDLRTLRPLLDQGRVRALRDELRWLGAALGTVRDSDVLLERLQADVAALDEPDQRGGRGLIERLERERERARGELLDVLASERYVALLDSLVAFGASPPLVGGGSRPARKAVPRLAARPWRRLRRAIANLPEPPSNDELHQVRIRVKHGRYAAELAAPVLGTPARRFARVLGALQDELGQLHDAVVAEQWLRTAASDVRAPGPFVAGLLAAKNRARQANGRRDWWALWRQARRKKLRRWLR